MSAPSNATFVKRNCRQQFRFKQARRQRRQSHRLHRPNYLLELHRTPCSWSVISIVEAVMNPSTLTPGGEELEQALVEKVIKRISEKLWTPKLLIQLIPDDDRPQTMSGSTQFINDERSTTSVRPENDPKSSVILNKESGPTSNDYDKLINLDSTWPSILEM